MPGTGDKSEVCHRCRQPLDELGFCRPCRAARSARWYSENSTVASARKGLQVKLRRRLGEHVETITAELAEEQGGVCACCGIIPERLGLNGDWSLDQVNDDGLPLVRAAICRRCKIALGRVLHPSRFTLQPDQLDAVERYLKRPWQDPDAVLRRAGVEVRRRVVGEQVASAVDVKISGTEAVADFLASIGAGG